MPLWQPPAAADVGASAVGPSPGDDATLPASAITNTHSTLRSVDHGRPSQYGRPSQAPHRPLTRGEVIGGRYVIKELAGEGGFASVYRAADARIPNHEVAVKLLNSTSTDPKTREAALRELTLIASVSHPSVVQFKDYGWHEGRLFFAMPWYRGHTLGGDQALDRASARRVFERCAYGLQAMHEAGICHYDIKPDNIFLAEIAGFEAGFPVLLDLGIAAKRGETPMALTPEYASPETAAAILSRGGTPVGTAADVYSLALSLRNVLEPETAPQLGESLPGFLHKRTLEPVEPPRSKELRYLQPMFKRWLSIDPTERPSAAEFALELAALTQPEEAHADRRRTLLRAAPLVLVLVAIAAVLGLLLTRKTKELVQQKAVEAREDLVTSARLEELKRDSQNQLDEKLQLAQEFQTQRDQFKNQRDKSRAQLETMTADRNRVHVELRTRTDERDQARTSLATEAQLLDETRADLVRRSADLDARTKELADERAALLSRNLDLATRTKDLATRTQERDQAQAERDRAQADLARRAHDVEELDSQLAAARADLDKRSKDLDRATHEQNTLQAQLAEATAAQKRLEAQLNRVTQERDQARSKTPPAQP